MYIINTKTDIDTSFKYVSIILIAKVTKKIKQAQLKRIRLYLED